jgi:hypothetical protein
MAMILTEKFLLPADADDAQRQAIVRQWMRKRRAVLADASSLFAPEVHGRSPACCPPGFGKLAQARSAWSNAQHDQLNKSDTD